MIKIILIIILILIFILQISNINEHFNNEIEMSPKLSKQDILDLKKGHKIMTNMLKEFDRICRKHNLKYWCMSGTLIGAIRHNGWIPWDGDIDIGMLKSDYDILQKIIKKELPKNMWFQDKTTDRYYKSNIGKIRELNTNYKDYDSKAWHNGLQLDIFIFHENKNYINGYKKFKKMDIFPLKEKLFENIKVYIPNNYRLILKIEGYNNYMTLVPINKRFPHEGRFGFFVPKWTKKKYPELYPLI